MNTVHNSPIDRRREQFPSLSSGIHLLSHSLGPMPRAAKASMAAYLDRWQGQFSEDAWASEWWTLSCEVGDLIAGLIGGDQGSVQVQPNASVAMQSAMSCFDLQSGPRRKVVTSSLDFHSMSYIWDRQRSAGVDVCIVPTEDGISIPMQRILEAIDADTALVALSYVSYRSSFAVDVPAIVARAKQVGARVLLDIYQAAGAIELDARGWGVDFMVGGTIKWLCGGPASGYLYVRPDLITELEPRLTGWIAHAAPFDFSHEPMRYAPEVRRFAQGTPSIPSLYSCLPGLKILEEVGIANIARETRRRAHWIAETLTERGMSLHIPEDPEQRGVSVIIRADDPFPLVARLAEQKVLLDGRPGVGLRLSTHFFNTDDEIEEAMEIICRG